MKLKKDSTPTVFFGILSTMIMVLASGNVHKQRELSQIFPEHTLLLPIDFSITFEHEEQETTFYGNAVGKARSLYEQLRTTPGASRDSRLHKIAVLADDSGLVVPALGGEPGIYSARYGSESAGRKLDDTSRNQFLLQRMKDCSDRAAYFVCSMALVYGRDQIAIIQETIEGEILQAMRGKGGFGYDPLFLIPGLGKTAAELDPSEKNRISHRGKAGAAMAVVLKTIERKLTG